MYLTVQSKKSTGVLTVKQIIFALVLLIVLIGQVSAIPLSAAPDQYKIDHGEADGVN